MKTGRLSKDDWAFIEFNSDKMSAGEIAKELGRAIEPIQRHLEKLGKTKNLNKNLQTQAEYDLKKRPYWRELQAQFSEPELEILLYHWKEIIAQFRRDILATEELQILDVIKLEVLMNRALREQQYSMIKIAEFDQMIVEERSLEEDADRELIFGFERQISTLRAAKESLSREYKDLQTKKSQQFRDLKATREQRVQKIENSKETFSELIQKLIRDPEFVEEQNLYMEKMRLSIKAERKRLTDYHQYDDGLVDQPFLTPESIIEE
jgi:IS30 family transposase